MHSTGKFLGHDIPDIDRQGLRQFGLIFAVIISILFGLILPFLFSFGYPLWPWIVAGVFILLALIIPNSLGPFYQLWMRFGVIMNIIMSRVILGTVFILTVVPAGLIFKLRRKDILNLKTDHNSTTYRQLPKAEDANNLTKPY